MKLQGRVQFCSQLDIESRTRCSHKLVGEHLTFHDIIIEDVFFSNLLYLCFRVGSAVGFDFCTLETASIDDSQVIDVM